MMQPLCTHTTSTGQGRDISSLNWTERRAFLQQRCIGVYSAMQRLGVPSTTREIAAAANMDLLTVRPRVTELCQLGFARLAARRRREGLYIAISLADAEAVFLAQSQVGASQLALPL